MCRIAFEFALTKVSKRVFSTAPINFPPRVCTHICDCLISAGLCRANWLASSKKGNLFTVLSPPFPGTFCTNVKKFRVGREEEGAIATFLVG